MRVKFGRIVFDFTFTQLDRSLVRRLAESVKIVFQDRSSLNWRLDPTLLPLICLVFFVLFTVLFLGRVKTCSIVSVSGNAAFFSVFALYLTEKVLVIASNTWSMQGSMGLT